MKNEWECLWKEVIMASNYAQFVAPFSHFNGGNEENHGTVHSRQPGSRPKSEQMTAQY
jgi:hypothetical protein